MTEPNNALTITYAHSHGDLYPHTIAAAYRHGRRMWDPDYALSEDPDIQEKVRRDPEILHAINRRLSKVANPIRHVEPRRPDHPSDQAVAGIFDDLWGEVEKKGESLRFLAFSRFVGRTYAKMSGCRMNEGFGGLESKNYFVIKRFTDIAKERVRFIAQQTNGKTWRKTQMYHLERHEWIDLERPELYIRHVYEDEERRTGHGRPMLEAIFFWHYSKSILLREGLQAAARFGQGFLDIAIESGATGDSGSPNTTVIKEWLDVAEDAQARHALAHDKADEVSMIPFPGQGAQFILDLIKYLDESMTKLITGSVRPTGGGEGGSYSRTEIEDEATEDMAKHDRTMLDEVLTRDYLGFLWRMNQPIIAELGLGDARCPVMSSSVEQREDPSKAATIISTVAPHVPLIKSWVYEKIGSPLPGPDDEMIHPPTQPGASPFPDFLPSNIGGDDEPEGEKSADGDTVAGGESIAAEGVEPPSMQEVSLAYERAIKNGDRATANLMRKKLWAITGEDREAPEISDAEWEEMKSGGGGGVTEDAPKMPKTAGTDQ